MPECGWDVAALLPHQPPMRLLDRIVACTREGIEAEVDILTDSEFAGADGVPAWIGVEYLGQAAAAYFTVIAGAPDAPAAPRAGMLVACPRYECTLPSFAPGSTLRIRTGPVSAPDAALVKFDGEIQLTIDPGVSAAGGGTVVARGALSVYMNPEGT